MTETWILVETTDVEAVWQLVPQAMSFEFLAGDRTHVTLAMPASHLPELLELASSAGFTVTAP